jgi:hypothetical protein
MADEDMQGIRVGVNYEEKRKAEKRVAGMKKQPVPFISHNGILTELLLEKRRRGQIYKVC